MADASLAPDEVIERYRVVRRIGVGGMAEVYRVEHTTLGTVHALKVLTLAGPTLNERMVAEGRVQASLRHPNVVQVSDVLFVRGMPALVMELVDGPDLGAWIAEARPDAVVAEQVFRGIVAGVAAAHAAGVIHRDLKPTNVLLATVAGTIVPKVGDFGIVKVASGDTPGHTRSGLPMGTPQYMAPEQMRDAASVDVRADVFSLGCILYELIAGRQAYGGSDLMDIFERSDNGRREPLPAGVPDRLRVLIDRCLARDPNDRPPDCATILAWLDGATIADPPERARDEKRTAPAPVARPTTIPILPVPWIAALTLVGGLGAMGFAALAIVLFAGARGSLDPLPPCPATGGRIGFVRAPAVFQKASGSVWTLGADRPVVAAISADGTSEVVCALPAGSRITLIEDPVETGEARWVAVDADRVAFGVPEVPSEDPAEVVGDLCRGPAGTRLGWFHTLPSGIKVPARGRTWRMNAAKQVVADYPRPETGNRAGPPVCAIPAKTAVEITEDVVKVGHGRGYWVPVTGTGP